EALAWRAFDAGRFGDAERHIARAEGLLAQWPDALRHANFVFLRGLIARAIGSMDRADRLFSAAGRAYAEAGNRQGRASVQNERGEMALHRGDLASAEQCYLRAHAVFDELDHPSVIATELNLGRVCDALGRFAEGGRWRRSARERAERAGNSTMGLFADATLLADDARAADWPAFDARLTQLDPLRDARLVALEVAQAAQTAAGLCLAAGQPERAHAARVIAIAQYHALGRHDLAAALLRARHR
ncbi:MAG: tetratricopeptide repeat protein, partial [Myxococcales bacterium]|nr:tetratricopeptide repeat protein [Myxococcales bacterium]